MISLNVFFRFYVVIIERIHFNASLVIGLVLILEDICVCVFLVSGVWASHCSLSGYLTIMGGKIFIVGFQPLPLSSIPFTLILWVPGGLSDDENVCNEAVDEIMRLLSDTNPNIKQWLIQQQTKDRHYPGTKLLEGPIFPQVQRKVQFTVREWHEKLAITRYSENKTC